MQRMLILCLILAAAGCSGETPPQRAKVDLTPYEWGNFQAPDTEGTDSESRSMRLSDSKGKVVLVDFWAGWCGPCRRLIPLEKDLVATLKDRPFVVFGVSADREREELRDAEKEEGVNWRSLWDDGGKVAEKWRIGSFPTLILVDHEGMVRYRFEGAGPTTTQNLQSAINVLLDRIPKK